MNEPETIPLIVKTNVVSLWFDFFGQHLRDVKALLKKKKTHLVLEILFFLSKYKEIQYYLVKIPGKLLDTK
jgi:hypothetical protein